MLPGMVLVSKYLHQTFQIGKTCHFLKTWPLIWAVIVDLAQRPNATFSILINQDYFKFFSRNLYSIFYNMTFDIWKTVEPSAPPLWRMPFLFSVGFCVELAAQDVKSNCISATFQLDVKEFNAKFEQLKMNYFMCTLNINQVNNKSKIYKNYSPCYKILRDVSSSFFIELDRNIPLKIYEDRFREVLLPPQ